MNEWVELLKNNDYIGVKKYIRDGADVNGVNEREESVLMLAIKSSCDTDLLMLLVKNGANIFEFDNEGVSVFDMAVAHNNVEFVKYMIKQGTNVNTTTRRSGFTPLMAAVAYSRIEIIKILLENGADINAVDSKGLSAIDFAKKLHKKNVLKLFFD